MQPQSPFARTFIALIGAIAMSSLTVGAAVGPASAHAHPVKVVVNA